MSGGGGVRADTTLLGRLKEASENSLTWHPRSPAEVASFNAAMTVWPALPSVVALVEAARRVAELEPEFSTHDRTDDESSCEICSGWIVARANLRIALAPFQKGTE